MAESLITETVAERGGRRDDVRAHAVLLLAGSADAGAPAPAEAVCTFEQRLMIGRREADLRRDADHICVLNDHLVSRVHCRITRAESGFFITDLDSRNGTSLDGRTIPGGQPVPLRAGQVLGIGQTVAVFRVITGSELGAIEAERRRPFGPVASAAPLLALAAQKLRKLALARGEVLLTGETGVGKEVYARAIHETSGRKGPFVAINCAALPRELVESELYGFARGAHSEARFDKRGLIEEAEGGTLFLDEIGDMAPELQAKLLRFLQDKELVPLGSQRRRRIDVRVVAATNRPVVAAGAGPGLRQDLASRLGAEPIELPPLRARREDLGRLAAALSPRPWKPFTPGAFLALALHGWPGNVRELGKVLEDAAALSLDEDVITVDHLPAALAGLPDRAAADPAARSGPRPSPSAAELEALLRRFSGNVARVARELDRKAPLVYRWCHRYQLDPNTFRTKD